MARKSTVQTAWEKTTLKGKMEVMRADMAALTDKLAAIENLLAAGNRSAAQNVSQLSQKVVDLELRVEEGKKSAAQEVSRLSKSLSEFNVRLSSMAANVLEVSAIAARAADIANKPEKRSSLWGNHDIEIKK
jgi:hypothetical protein